MKSTSLFASLIAASVIWLPASCSSKSDNGTDDGAGGEKPETEAGTSSGGAAGKETGGTAGKGSGGIQSTGGKNESGGAKNPDAGSDGSSGGGTTDGGGGAPNGDAGSGGSANGGADAGNGGTPGTGGNDSGSTTSCDDGHGDCDNDGTCEATFSSDAKNCGHCGRNCGGGDCTLGDCSPVTILQPTDPPSGFQDAFLMDGGKIYEWKYGNITLDDTFHYQVYSLALPVAAPVPPTTGTIIQSIASTPTITAVAFDSAYVYEATKTQVQRKALSGAATPLTKLFTLPASFTCDDFRCMKLAVSATDAYVYTGDTLTAGATGAFYSLKISPVPAATAVPAPIAGLGGRDPLVFHLTVIGTHLFWLEHDFDTSDYFLYTAPITGGAGSVVKLDDVTTSESSIVSDGTSVFWTVHNSAGTLRRVPLTNLTAAAVKDVTDFDNAAEGIALDAQYAYVMEAPSPHSLFRVLKAGGDREFLGDISVGSEDGQKVIGVDANYVYVGLTDGSVARITKLP